MGSRWGIIKKIIPSWTLQKDHGYWKYLSPIYFLSVFDSTDWVHVHQAHTRNAMIVLHLLIRMDSLATNRYKYT